VKKQVILDVDTGTDDAIAIMLAILGKEIDLLGITTVNGNLELALTTDNTLRVVEHCEAGEAVKVYSGCEYPLVSTLSPKSAQSLRPLPKRAGVKMPYAIHGDHLPLPETTLKKQDKNAIVWMIETVMQAEPQSISLVAVGPLSNVATAMRAEPDFAERLREIVIMGGGDRLSNASSAAEFNIWADPEAAEIVLQSGCEVTIIPLDATHDAQISEADLAKIKAIGNKYADFTYDVIMERIDAYADRKADRDAPRSAPVHDALALCYLLHPECITKKADVSCHVDISGGVAYGRTVIDDRQYMETSEPNCTFAYDADKEFFFDWMYNIIARAEES